MNEELKIIISAQTASAQKNIQEAKQKVEDLGKDSKKASETLSKAMSAIGNATKTALKVTAGAVAAAGTALVALAESTREYRTEQAKLTTAFEAAGATAEQAKETYNDLYRVLGDSGQATEAAAHLAQLTTNEKDLAEWTNVCQGIYATFGDSLPIESLTEAANETAKVGTVTGSLADALNWAGISEDAFNESLAACNTEAEREKLIRETLNGIYNDAAQTYEKNASSILSANEAQAKLTDTLAQLGAVAEPIIAIFKGGLADVLAELVPSLEMVSSGLQDVINGVDGGAEKLGAGISGLLGTVIDTVVSLLPTFITVGIELIGALIEGIISAAPQILSGIVSAISIVISSLPSMIKMVMDALIALTPQLITSIIDLIVLLCNNIDSILQPLIEALPLILIAVTDGLMSNLDKLISGIINLVMGVVESIPLLLESLIDALPTVISLTISGLLSNLPLIISGLIKVALGVAKSLPSILSSVIKGAVNVFAGIWDGLKNVFGNVGSWFSNKFKEAVNAIKNAFSGVVNFFSGIWNGIKNVFSKIGSTVGNAITGAVKKAINGILSTAVKIINGFIGAINLAISVINAIPGVNIKKLDTLNVPKLERGGVLKKGQIGLLEGNGAEAVVPLEKNTEWLDKIAERLNSRGGNAPIILQVDGKTFAEIAVDSINDLTRLKGRLPLVMA